MRSWKKRIISLVLAVSMIFGLAPSTLMPVQAAENLNAADGIIWLTKNEAGNSVSEEFESMVTGMKLDDMVREALGIETSDEKVYFDGVDVGNAMDLAMNMSKVNALIDKMKEAITNHELVTFNVGSNAYTIAFRNVISVAISAGEDNKIYIDNAGAPADANTLKGMINDALNNTAVSVAHNGVITTTGFYTASKARFEASAFKAEGGASYAGLLKQWPTIASSPESNVKKAGEVEVTIYAAEYNQKSEDDKPNAKVTQIFEVYMRDQRVTVNAAAKKSDDTLVQDDELKSLTQVYNGSGAPSETPVSKYYTFVEWMTPGHDGYDYTAIMKAKKDNNNNGIHDDLETLDEFTVKYLDEETEYEASEKVTDGGMPIGPEENPTREGYKFTGWVTDDGVKWPAKVTGDVVYKAQWEELPEEGEETPAFTVTGTLVIDGREGSAQELSYSIIGEDTNEYKVVDPGWEDLAMDGYACIGWYYKVEDGGQDINKDGEAKEMPFNMDAVWIAEDDTTLELYCEFLPTVEVYDPESGTTVEVSKGTAEKLYSYTIVYADGTEIPLDPSLSVLDKDDLPVPEYNARISTFEGYDIVKNSDDSYTATPILDTKWNTFGVASEIENFAVLKEDAYGATYTIDNKYTSEVTFSSVDGNNGVGYVYKHDKLTHTYAIDPNTSATITPFTDSNGEIVYYVTGLTAYYQGDVNGIPLDITYNDDCSATAENIYAQISSKISTARSTGSLSGVELVPEYKALWFDGNDEITLKAAQENYNSEEIYNKVFDRENLRLEYNAENVEILYKAQEDKYTVNLNKIFELLEADGLGVLKSQIPEDYTTKAVYPTTTKWISIDDSAKKSEKTAQEAADEYIIEKYNEYKADNNIDLLQFVANVYSGLDDRICQDTHHRFGYIAPVNPANEEALRITYVSEATGKLEKEVKVILDDSGRKSVTITATNVTCSYGEDIVAAIMEKIECSESIAEGAFVTYDADTQTARDFSGVGVGSYNVQIAFMGNTEYKSAMSNNFKLTVNAVETTVTVEQLVTMEGNMSYDKVSATVTPEDVPIVQIIAGIATDELTFGVNTEGNVKDWALEFDDETMTVDVWVKLPQSYMDLLSNVNIKDFYPESPIEKIEPGKKIPIDDLEKALEDKGLDDQAQIQQVQAIIDQIPEIVKEKLGISDLTYAMNVRFDALEKKVYPTNSGFYLNYAATLSRFNNFNGSNIEVDKNHTASEDYGFIVISPMVPIPNRGGVQLYDGTVDNAQNVFVYEYDVDEAGKAIKRELEVAVDGEKLDDEALFYYGVTTRLKATTEKPSKPGVYFAGYNYTKEVKNEDSGEMELKRLGSDSAIIVIKQREADLTITGGIYEYKEENGKAVNQIADVKITDKDGNEIEDKGVTVISGTVNVNDDGTNVSLDDLYGTVNVDLPDALQSKWSAFCTEKGYDSDKKIKPSDFITFLEICRDNAKEAADTALEGFKTLAMKDAVSDVLDKINDKQNIADVSSDSLVAKAERVQEMLNTSVAYYNRMLEEFEPLRNLNNKAELTFYDLKTESDKLDYGKTGYYLYAGVITDPDLTPAVGKGLVIIHSKDDYIMYDTHVPYDGDPHSIEFDDDTCRGDVSIMVDRQANEIKFFVDGDVFGALNAALSNIPHTDVKLNDGSDVVVSTVYDNAEGKVGAVYDKLLELLQDGATKLLNAMDQTPKVKDEIKLVKEKVQNLTAKISDKLQEIDGDTTIVIYNKQHAGDLQGMPVDAGTYEFYGYDYDVKVTRGTLVIEPIYIEVEDEPASKYEGEADPVLKANVTCYSFEGKGADVNQVDVTVSNVDKLVNYKVERKPGEEVGKYDISVKELELLDKSGNYVLAERTEDLKDFKILPEIGTLDKGIWKMDLDGVVYLNYYPNYDGFSESFDFLDPEHAGAVIWTGETAPTDSDDLMVGKNNTDVIEGWIEDVNGELCVQTPEIYAKNLGDMVYIRPYVKDSKGNYKYTPKAYGYSPELFCYDVLDEVDANNNLAQPEGKRNLCASLLFYGASAQEYFAEQLGYNVEEADLVTTIPNKFEHVQWSDYSSILEYSDEYIDKLVVDESVRALAATLMIDECNKVGITRVDTVLDLVGAIKLHSGYTINENIIEIDNIDKAEVLFWNERDFADIIKNENSLEYKYHNYSFKYDLVKASGTETVYVGDYLAQSDYIVAKYLGETVYSTCRIQMKDGKVYNSGLLPYSPDAFAADHIAVSQGKVKALCERIIVYGEMAERWFIGNN